MSEEIQRVEVRRTERREIPAVLAIARPVQCVASAGGGAQVRITTRCTTASLG
jgi:hypothetical protein